MRKLLLLLTVLSLASCRSDGEEEKKCDCYDQQFFRDHIIRANTQLPIEYTSDWYANPPGDINPNYRCSDNGRESIPESITIDIKPNGDIHGVERKTVIKCN